MIYEYQCSKGHLFEKVMSVSEHCNTATCDCGSPADQVFSRPPAGYVQRECRYDSPIDGRAITSRAQRLDDMARHGCQEYDPEMRKDVDRFQRDEQAKLDKSVDESVAMQIEKMNGTQREKLGAELTSGVDATIVRNSV